MRLFLRHVVNFPCIKQAPLLMGDEKGNRKEHLSVFSVDYSVAGRTRAFLSSHIADCQSALTSLHQRDWQIDTPANTGAHACTGCTMQSLISQLQQIRTNVIVFDPKCGGGGLWGNSDISIWCEPYVSRTLLGPIKLIFNVCPTLDGPSQGWHSSRGDMISVWLHPRCALACSQSDLWESITDVLPSHNWLKHLQWTEPATQYRDGPTSN